VQICNTCTGEAGYIERKKTGSLYAVRNIYKQLVNDDEWFKLNVLVQGKRVQVRLNGTLVVDYIEPAVPVLAMSSPPARAEPRHVRAAGARCDHWRRVPLRARAAASRRRAARSSCPYRTRPTAS
jgi:hypothetical protein